MVAHYSDDERYIEGYDSAGSRIVVVDEEDIGELEASVYESQDCDGHDSMRVLATLDDWGQAAEVVKALNEALDRAAQAAGEASDGGHGGDTPCVQEEDLEDTLYGGNGEE